MSSARPDTWMPLYWGDYLKDTGRLTTEGHGAYLLLIADYWTSGAPLPDDDEQLAAIVRLPLARWQKLRRTLEHFFQIAEGQWHHHRIDRELDNATARSTERSAAGKEGAKARWSHRQTNGSANGKRIAEPIANGPDSQWQNDAQSQSPSEAKASGQAADPIKDLFDTGVKILKAAGITERDARTLVGKWRKEVPDEKLIGFITGAAKATDPVAYVAGAIRRHHKPHGEALL